jgi:hypothetical protein
MRERSGGVSVNFYLCCLCYVSASVCLLSLDGLVKSIALFHLTRVHASVKVDVEYESRIMRAVHENMCEDRNLIGEDCTLSTNFYPALVSNFNTHGSWLFIPQMSRTCLFNYAANSTSKL